jgi:hypothetical protein
MTGYNDTHEDHLEWCKVRAREYMDRGDYQNAFTSMMSDLGKHPDWQDCNLIGAMTMLYIVDPSPDTVRRIIEGFR